MTYREDDRRYPWGRLLRGIGFAALFALGIYLLLEAAGSGAVIGFAFLLVLPAAICAFLAYIADPWRTRTHRQYLMIPVWVLIAVVVVSAVFLREGVICILMLAPLWLIAGSLGAEFAYRMRKVPKDGRTYCSAILAAPLTALMLEPLIPVPTNYSTVSRSAVIDATAQELWPLAQGIPDVRADEGRWNISQDVIGVPRPVGARLVGRGTGAQRLAVWGDHIRFREVVTDWQQDRHLAWRFAFDEVSGWGMTDRHLMPNSDHFRVVSGGYRLEPLANGKTRVTLETTYRATTPLNGYGALWGELFLGDLENNLLATLAQRAAANRKARASLHV